MKNLFTVDFAENKIIASKTTLKKRSVPNSPEYRALMKLMKQNPTFAVAEKQIREATGKKTYKGLTEAFIKSYISIQENAVELTTQYEKASEMGKFPLIRRWFLDKFENFNMEIAKEELKKAAIKKVTFIPAEQRTKVVDMPAAANM